MRIELRKSKMKGTSDSEPYLDIGTSFPEENVG